MDKRQARNTHYYNLLPVFDENHDLSSPHNRVFGKRNIFARRWNLALRYLRYISQMEHDYMPPKAYNNGKGSPMPVFANVRLAESDKEAFSEWCEKKDRDFVEMQTRLLVEGWKLSIRADLENNCFIVSHTCGAEKHINANVCLTSRSEDWEEALWLNLYKILSLYDGKKLPTENARNNWG